MENILLFMLSLFYQRSSCRKKNRGDFYIYDKMAEPALDKFPKSLDINGEAQSNNGMWTGHGLDGDIGSGPCSDLTSHG